MRKEEAIVKKFKREKITSNQIEIREEDNQNLSTKSA